MNLNGCTVGSIQMQDTPKSGSHFPLTGLPRTRYEIKTALSWVTLPLKRVQIS
jgi:hypothetical protein